MVFPVRVVPVRNPVRRAAAVVHTTFHGGTGVNDQEA